MTTIKIEDLNINPSIIDLETSEITDVQGGCPWCWVYELQAWAARHDIPFRIIG